MNASDTQLAGSLREQLTERINTELQGLVANPTERRAGRVEAMQDMLGLVNGTYAKLNDIKPTQERK